MCSWSGRRAPGANFISEVMRPVSRSTSSVFISTPAKRVFSQGSFATSTKREASGGSSSWRLAFGVNPLMFASSAFAMLADPHDLHRVRAAGLADRLADREHDQVAFLDDIILHQHLL